MSHRMPSEPEIRQRIMEVQDDQHRLGFMYQYLIAGRISEVCGRYAPQGVDAFPVKMDGVKAILFSVKTAKRKGKLRACAIPLNTEYEPWIKELADYFEECGDKYPFQYSKNWSHSVRYQQFEAVKAFDGLEWPMMEYTRKLDEDTTMKVPNRWNPFRSHALRKRRTLTLRWDYDFNGFELAAYGGWTEKSQVDTLPDAMKFYLHMDIQSVRESIKILIKMAKGYFPKLCTSYEELM